MRRPIYGGAIQANVIGSFVRLGQSFLVIHPGYDAQGRKRTAWKQVVHEDVPIWEHKLEAALPTVLERFSERFVDGIGDDTELLIRALTRCKAARRAAFMDGKSGVEPAPTLHDGRSPGVNATS